MLRGAGLATVGEPPFAAFYDYIFHTAQTLRLVGQQEGLDAERMGTLLRGESWLPCEFHPSDHLPVAAVLEFGASD